MGTCSSTLRLVVLGHVDHGKSTIIGRLLADTGSLPLGRIEEARLRSERLGKQLEYSFLLDALADEQAQGITMDSARAFIETEKHSYQIIDAPGHVELLGNALSAASRADAALLVIDGTEEALENSRRHVHMISLLGIRHLLAVVNKMDLLAYDQAAFRNITAGLNKLLRNFHIRPLGIIPVSGLAGDNISLPSLRMPWYEGSTLRKALDALEAQAGHAEEPFRMFVQDAYTFSRFGDQRRLIAGTIDSGRVSVGDEMIFYPSGKVATVATIERFNAPPALFAVRGEAVSFTLVEDREVCRGELAALRREQRPKVSARLRGTLFWLAREPMKKNVAYELRIGTAKAAVRIQGPLAVAELGKDFAPDDADCIPESSIAVCDLILSMPLAFDELGHASATSRFVIADNHRICGGGTLHEVTERTWPAGPVSAYSLWSS